MLRLIFSAILAFSGQADEVVSSEPLTGNLRDPGRVFLSEGITYIDNGLVRKYSAEQIKNNPLLQKIVSNPFNKLSGPPPGAIADLACFYEKYKDSYFESTPAGKGKFRERCNRFALENGQPLKPGQTGSSYFKIGKECNAMITDYTADPQSPRSWLVNICTGKITQAGFAAAHGRFKATSSTNNIPGLHQGTVQDPLDLDDFSNVPDTNASATGFLVASHVYRSSNPDVGQALVMHGVEEGINENACRRGTVIHAKEGVSCQEANALTSGCIGVCKEVLPDIFTHLQGNPKDKDKSGQYSGGGLIYVIGPKEKETLGNNCGRNVRTAPVPRPRDERPN